MPKLKKGFFHASADLAPEAQFIVYAGTDRYTVSDGIEAINVRDLADELTRVGG